MTAVGGDGADGGGNFDGIGVGGIPSEGDGVAGVWGGVVGGEGGDGGTGGGRVEGEGSKVVDLSELGIGEDAELVAGLEDGDVVDGSAEVV